MPISYTNKKQTDGAKNRSFRNSLRAVKIDRKCPELLGFQTNVAIEILKSAYAV